MLIDFDVSSVLDEQRVDSAAGQQPTRCSARERKMKMRLDVALTAFLAGVAMLAAEQTMAAAFYLTQVGTPLSIGTVGVANTVNNWGADASWAQPAGMVDLKEDTVHVQGDRFEHVPN